jgi:hypothetical protein
MKVRALLLATCAFGIVGLARGPSAQDLLPAHKLDTDRLAQYRNFALKSDLAAVSAVTGAASSEAKTTHERPAVLQELQWRPSRWTPGSTSTSTDPVEQIGFSFYNNQLFRIVVDYAHDRTEGMTDADMIEALTAVYGLPVKRVPAAPRVATRGDSDSGSAVARWGDANYAVVLFRTSSYNQAFRLTVTEPALDELARKAEMQAVRLDEQSAPSREIARQKKEQEDGRAAAEKARIVNKGGFRP